MKTENRELLGFTVPIVNICETLAEAITAAGGEQAVLNDYNSNVLAHSHYTIARRAIIKSLVEQSGVKQLTKNVGTAEKPKLEVVEKDAAYVARLESELGEDMVKSFGTKVSEAVGQIKVDYTPGTRGAGGSATPAKKWLAYYDQLVTEEKLSAFCSKHDIPQDTDEETLKFAVANKVREIVTAKMEAAAQAALSAE